MDKYVAWVNETKIKNTINKKQQKTHIKYNKNLIKTERYVLLFVDAQGRMAYNGCI